MNLQNIDSIKRAWVEKHLIKTSFPVEYLSRPDNKSRHLPMTAAQFNKLENIGNDYHKLDPPATYKAIFPYKDNENVLWYTDNDIQTSTLEELQDTYNEWKEIANSIGESD